jgi:hypothetical protein
VSSLWTPSGEHEPGAPGPGGNAGPGGSPPAGPPAGPPDGPVDEAELAAEMHRVRAELAATPVEDLVANHAVGLWQLAVLHLVPDGDEPPRLDHAAVAIDAFAAIVETLGSRLAPHEEPLRDALGQLRMAFVQVQERGSGGSGP